MSTPHLEVIPRIIDSSLSANYQKQEPKQEPKQHEEPAPQETSKVSQVVAPIALTFTQKFFRTLKDYMIPILFIIAVIAIAYIVWTYFTKYRNKTIEEPSPEPLLVSTIEDKPDLSRYVFDEEESSNEDSNEERNNHTLSTIEEISEEESKQEESEEESENDESGEESGNESNTDDNLFEILSKHSDKDEDKPPSLITEPDLDVISNLINQPIDDTYIMQEHRQFDYVDETPAESETEEESIFTLLPESDKPKPKRTRKPKRVVL